MNTRLETKLNNASNRQTKLQAKIGLAIGWLPEDPIGYNFYSDSYPARLNNLYGENLRLDNEKEVLQALQTLKFHKK